MESTPFNGEGYRMGPRIPIRRDIDRHVIDIGSLVTDLRIPPSRVIARADTTTAAATSTPSELVCTSENANLCEKPIGSQALTLPIALGIIIPVVGAVVAILYFHRRNVLRQRKEDAVDPHMNLDFGLGEGGNGGKGKGKGAFGGEKSMDPRHRVQMSMDMNLSSPYLLPPGLQSSRESLHSLARTLHNNEDPYRPVQYANSEVGSIRSFRPGHEGSSVYTGSTERRASTTTKRSAATQNLAIPPPRQNSLPKPPSPTADPFATPTTGSMTPQMSRPDDAFPEPVVPQIGTVPYPDDKYNDPNPQIGPLPEMPLPPPVAQPNSRNAPPKSPRSGSGDDYTMGERAQFDQAHVVGGRPRTPSGPKVVEPAADRPILPEIGLGLSDLSFHSPPRLSPPQVHSLPSSPRPQRDPAPPPTTLPVAVPEETNTHEQYDNSQGYQNQDFPDHGFDERGRSAQRRSMDFGDVPNQHQHQHQQQLGIPEYENRRLSVGFRPLPPDDMMEFEDPEERANRIRSFYKEYFDDHKGEPQNYPQMPAHVQGQGQGQVPYYEDYDQNYMGAEAAYFDPETNSFVMPYSQPVTRRAMTPPPRGSRFRGGPPPPRGMHGSIGGMSMQGGGRGPRPRVGSAMSNSSNRWGPPRPGSSMSGQWGPRPGSSASNMSNRFGQKPRGPKGPPPAPLTTLPNPSKLKDDSFALMGALEFAPPDNFRDQAAGRSQSPIGERRPYAINVPVHSPLVSSFEEMPSVPSPHMLRKSGTFTGLDFAPPKRFKDADTMSDSGSIRSNRSGISAVNTMAIRNGAGRVSRLPGDNVFTQAALQDTLKPNWGMRHD